jgi:DNA (cytosine-5)-methyltransferase 1
MKVLNLYACLGGNRLKWDNCDVTAVEIDPFLCELYQKRFPNDIVICADAHQYLLDHYKEFDFIWSSPPCPTHSKSRFARHKSTKPEFPDMKLYQEIIFLKHYFKGKFCVENVIGYYDPLIPAVKKGRHYYWTNFVLPYKLSNRKSNFMENKNEVENWKIFHQFNFSEYKGKQRIDKIARNLVDFEAGKTIYDAARNIYENSNLNQMQIDFHNIAI